MGGCDESPPELEPRAPIITPWGSSSFQLAGSLTSCLLAAYVMMVPYLQSKPASWTHGNSIFKDAAKSLLTFFYYITGKFCFNEYYIRLGLAPGRSQLLPRREQGRLHSRGGVPQKKKNNERSTTKQEMTENNK